MSVSTTHDVQNSTTGATYVTRSSNSYTVLYGPNTGASDYKATFNYTYDGFSDSGTVWIQTDGIVAAVYTDGENLTEPAAFTAASGPLTYPFELLYLYSQNSTFYGSANPYYQLLNTTQVTLGPTTFTVSSYGLTTPYTTCQSNGKSISYTSGLIQQGRVPGTKLPLLTYIETRSTLYAAGGTLTDTSVTRVTSVTKA